MLINNTKATLQHINGFTLKPGINSIDIEVWKEARKHKSVQKKLRLGLIEEEMEIEDEDGTELEDHGCGDAYSEQDYAYLGELKLPQARNIVKETFDVALLNEWLKREQRDQLKTALEKQIELMSAELEERDRNQTRQIVTGKGPEIIELKANPNSSDD